MKKTIFYSLLISILLLSFSCSRDDDSGTSNNLLNAKLVLTQGSASILKITPIDKDGFYDSKDVIEKQNINQLSFTLPNYTDHFNMSIQGSQKNLKGYIEINGKKSEFTVIDWYFQATYYLDDFK